MAGQKMPKQLFCTTCKGPYQPQGQKVSCPRCWPSDYADQTAVNKALVMLGQAQVQRLDSIKTAGQWTALILAGFAALVIVGFLLGLGSL